MAATDREKSQAHDAAKRGWERLRDSTAAPRTARSKFAVVPDFPAPTTPAAPTAPAAPSAAEIATSLTASLPRWAFGERRVARRLAPAQATQIAERQAAALNRARDEHQQVVAQAELLREKRSRDRAAEKRLLDSVEARRDRGEEPVVEFLATELQDRRSFPSRFAFRDGRAIVVVGAVALSEVPEREPTTTAAGKPTSRKLNKGERNDAQASATAERAAGALRLLAGAAPSGADVEVWAIDRDGLAIGHLKLSATEASSRSQRDMKRAFAASITRSGAAKNVVGQPAQGLPPDLQQSARRLG